MSGDWRAAEWDVVRSVRGSRSELEDWRGSQPLAAVTIPEPEYFTKRKGWVDLRMFRGCANIVTW